MYKRRPPCMAKPCRGEGRLKIIGAAFWYLPYLYILPVTTLLNSINMSKSAKNKKDSAKEKEEVFGDPIYESNEDIYSKGEKDEDLDIDSDPDRQSRRKAKADKSPGDDLDVPGSELDDDDEEIGEEDEENNYYSLGGDDHDDLEEDKGD
jgi:hypothetical protein